MTWKKAVNSPREQVISKLKQDGWFLARQSGSHLIYKKLGNVNTISVPQDSRGFGVRVYKKILCDLKNGSKFERRELKGATLQAQPVPTTKTPMPPPKPVSEPRTAPAHAPPPAAMTSPPKKRGKPELQFADEKILEAVAAFEDGATLDKVSVVLRCSSQTTKKQLAKFYGEERFAGLLAAPISDRKPKAAAYFPSVPVGVPKPLGTLKTPLPLIPTLHPKLYDPPGVVLSDILNMKAEVKNGVAYVELEMEMGSPTFLLLCKWRKQS